jgi:hypothetical protein
MLYTLRSEAIAVQSHARLFAFIFPIHSDAGQFIANRTNLRGEYRQKHEHCRMFRCGPSGNVPIMQSPARPILPRTTRMAIGASHPEKRQRLARELPAIEQRVKGGFVRT